MESQVFLVVNNPKSHDITALAKPRMVAEKWQGGQLPDWTGKPVVYRGSITEPGSAERVCLPAEVTWSVRPACAKLDINSLNKWVSGGNIFNETKPHRVRNLVTNPDLISSIQ